VTENGDVYEGKGCYGDVEDVVCGRMVDGAVESVAEGLFVDWDEE